jgi:hypothetical protein
MKKFMVLVLLVLVFPCFAHTAMYNEHSGRKIVTTAGTAVPLTSSLTPFHSVDVCAETDNTGVIAIGGSDVIATLATRTGIPLAASDCKTFKGEDTYNGDLSSIYIDSTVSTDGVTYRYSTPK